VEAGVAKSRRGAAQAAARTTPGPSPVGLAESSSRLRFFFLRGGGCGGSCGGGCSDGAVASRLGRACFASGAARLFNAVASFIEGGGGTYRARPQASSNNAWCVSCIPVTSKQSKIRGMWGTRHTRYTIH
jgi:hypothetical protein